MSTKRVLSEGTIARRALLRTVGGTFAGAVVASQASGATPESGGQSHDHAQPTPGAASQGATAVVDALPRALDDHERSTLAALGEHLVPGSTDAGVPQLIDRLLAVDEPAALRRFRQALGAFEHEARARHSKAWLELTAAEQVEMLTRASAMPPSAGEPEPWRPGQPVIRPAVPAGPTTLRDHLEQLRDTIARVYFSTETGMKELGWTGLEFWDALPECRQE